MLFVLALLAVSACGRVPVPSLSVMTRAVPSERLPFETRLLSDRRSPDLSVAVDARGAGLDAVRESVRFEGTRYCLRSFGSSRIDWIASPADPRDWIATVDARGRQVYSGRCVGR